VNDDEVLDGTPPKSVRNGSGGDGGEHLVHALPRGFHVLLRHRLPPFLGEAFGGSTGLVDL
jgi:hypothetical protein